MTNVKWFTDSMIVLSDTCISGAGAALVENQIHEARHSCILCNAEVSDLDQHFVGAGTAMKYVIVDLDICG